ncbi:MAG: uracil-DNA glycosylase [Bacteroidales bacterium]|nr:uracil-DNA glycosylase [Bacteroidales bacterium]
MSNINPVIETSWLKALAGEFGKSYFFDLKKFLVEEKRKFKIYPPGSEIFAAFNYTPFDRVKVVILGQDPYHGPGQANGLCFSVKDGIRQPPSLQNIFKEMKNDLGYEIPGSGNLENWARQGVLLLNATLTVRSGEAGSHQGKGWEQFTDSAIAKLSEEKEKLVFILWGKYAQAKQILINPSKHHIIKSPHPSPFSADRGFFGSRPFSKTNTFLREVGLSEIDWHL